MNSVDIDRYYRDTFSLVRTMVIKIGALADRDNEVLKAANYPVSSDKRTWRYYMNLNGDYHPTDDMMVVTSIDTGEEINFTKEVLLNHIATLREYQKGGHWYTRLMEAYPHQPALINGILSPIPYEETIEAEDYKILRWNKNLVLWNEDQLIPKLQRHITANVAMMFKNDYITTDDLMLTLMLRKLYAMVTEVIHAIRLEDAFTRHAHEFFVWSHIDSFGDFSQYKASLTRPQIMWLFRNIAWLKNNPGQMYSFNKLVANILTPGAIPIAKYDMVESTETILEDLTPNPLYRRMNLNLIEDYGRTPEFIETEVMINKQQTQAKENYPNTSIYLEDALKKGKFSLHSELPTKALESSMMDYTNRHADTLMSVAYNEWIYLAGNGKFKGRSVVVDPKSGKQHRIPVTDLYHLWKYLVVSSRGIEPTKIDKVYYQNVSKIKPPTIAQLRDMGGPAFIDPKLAADIRALWDPVAVFVAPDYLIQYAFQVYDWMWAHKKLYSQFYDLNKRARVKHTTKLMYGSGIVKLGNYTDYRTLLNDYKFDFSEYTSEEKKGFAWEIFKRVTGWDTNTQPSMRVKQSDLIDIMMELSSYTIHTIKEMDDGTDVTEVPNEISVGDPRWIGKGNDLEGEFKYVQLHVPTNNDLIGILEANIPVVSPDDPKLEVGSEAIIKVVVPERLKFYDIEKGLKPTSIKFPDNTYIRVVEDEELP